MLLAAYLRSRDFMQLYSILWARDVISRASDNTPTTPTTRHFGGE